MAQKEAPFAEANRKAFNFCSQFKVHLEDIITILGRAAEAESFIEGSSKRVADLKKTVAALEEQEAQIKETNGALRSSGDDVKKALDEKAAHLRAEIRGLESLKRGVAHDLVQFRAEMENQKQALLQQNQDLVEQNAKLQEEVDSKSRLLSSIQKRIENADAILAGGASS